MSDNKKALPWLTTFIPILVSVIATCGAIWSLSRQIAQQNELERKKVEATYLLKALDTVSAPGDILTKLAQDTHELKNRIKVLPADRTGNYDASYANLVVLQRSMKEYSDAMLRATYFAELIEADSVLRARGRNELFDALQAAQDAAVELMKIVPDVLPERVPIDQLGNHPLYRASEAANHRAARAIITRLSEIYAAP